MVDNINDGKALPPRRNIHNEGIAGLSFGVNKYNRHKGIERSHSYGTPCISSLQRNGSIESHYGIYCIFLISYLH